MFKVIGSIIVVMMMCACGLGMTAIENTHKRIACFCGIIVCMGAMIIIMEIL